MTSESGTPFAVSRINRAVIERCAVRYWIALFLIASPTALAAQETEPRAAVHIKRFKRINASYYRGTMTAGPRNKRSEK